jgi:hypothetical protein
LDVIFSNKVCRLEAGDTTGWSYDWVNLTCLKSEARASVPFADVF